MTDFIVAFASGALSSMGVGGGAVLLLYLTAFAGYEQLSAQGINLVFFLPAAAIALVIHIKNGYVKWRGALVSVLFGICGVFLGSCAAGILEGSLLRKCFAIFLLVIGIRELFSKPQNKNGE